MAPFGIFRTEVVMLERYFVKPSTVDRIRGSWLAPEIERYVEWMAAQGYAIRNVYRRVPILCHFAEFAKLHGSIDLKSASTLIEEFALHWLASHGSHCMALGARCKISEEARNPVRQMLRLALEGHVTAARTRKLFPFEDQAPGFLRYLREERGLREATIYKYVHCLNGFAGFLKRSGVTLLTELSPALLAAFVVDTAPKLACTGKRDLCGMIRVFLRFCHRQQVITKDLSDAVEMPQSYRLADVPRSITWDEVRRMLEAVDRRTVLGRRDYAILLLLVTYGLRAHEVAKLTLDDIDWKRERLQIPERKAGHWTAYPLANVVAEALIEYLRSGRPQTEDRHVFFRVLAPRSPITNGAVSATVAKYLRKAGVQVRRAGAHTLRHTCVQRLIDAEFPLKTIGDYVGHRSPQSTEIYSKVAIATLREVAMGDGEEL
jgi:site-specific recombinase XerD